MRQSAPATLTVAEPDDVTAPVVTPTGCSGIATIASSLTQGTWSSSAMGALSGTSTIVSLASGTCSVQIADGNGQSQTVSITAIASGTITEFGSTLSQPNGRYGVAFDSTGNLWVTENNGYLAKITPAGTLTEFNLSATLGFVIGIVNGPDNNLWVTYNTTETAYGNAGIAKVSTSGSVLTTFPVASLPGTRAPLGPIVTGSDGNLWYVAATTAGNGFNTVGYLAKISTSGSGSIVCTGTSNLFSLTTSLNGGTIYSIEGTDNISAGFYIMTMPVSGSCNESSNGSYALNNIGTPSSGFNYESYWNGGYPFAINWGTSTTTTDGSSWGILGAVNGNLSGTPTQGTYLIYNISTGGFYNLGTATPMVIAGGQDGNLWIGASESGTGAIWKVSLDFKNVGSFTKTSSGSQLSNVPVAILAAPTGLVWFIESGGKYGYASP